MRRRRRSHELHSVTLFPFLAVLICTFGVLIILLVIVVKAADSQAQQQKQHVEEQNQVKLSKLQQTLELEEIRAEGYRTLQPELLSQLSLARDRQAALQSEIESLANEAVLLEKQLNYADSSINDQHLDRTRQQLAALQQQLDDERDLLNKKRRSLEQVSSQTKFSVVPYSGTNGTQRRPIYIECESGKLTLQPYGIELGHQDFVQPILPNNPLDAALIAVKEYFVKNRLSEERNQSPYPLLIVRPEGPGSYALARHAMKSWDEEFGYELIAADKQLDFGESDPQLEEVIADAVNAAKQRQREYVASKILNRRQENNQIRTADGLFASGRFGGFVNSEGRVVPAAAEKTEEFEAKEKGQQPNSRADRQADIAVRNLDNAQNSIANEKGKDWALPSKSAGAIAYRRPVKVYVSNDQLIVNSDAQNHHRIEISIANQTRDSVDQLVEAIWQRMESWGVAGAGGYWKPELDVKVLPGGQQRFQQIKKLLENSGIELREKSL